LNKLARAKMNTLLNKVSIIQKRIKNILKECVKSDSETLSFWTGKEKELKDEYNKLKYVYSIIAYYIIEREYNINIKEQSKRINNLKSVPIHVNKEFRKKNMHKKTINILCKNAYNKFVIALDTGYKKKIDLLSNIQQAIINVNKVKNDT
jgi:hypothetical protein